MPDHPRTIGKYKVTRPLGKGAMGIVYEGFDPVIERKVAIKTILSEYLEAAEMEEAVARFKREAQAGGRLQHPGIVGVYEYGNDADMAFIVMEFVEGWELKRILASGVRYELPEVCEIMKQLLSALDYSHKAGVVHRDIKPANVMVMHGPKIKVMDFGIARLESSSLTQVGTVVGTPTHMSPEQLMGVTADGRADIWAAGVILYELLTGVSPFHAETPAAVMHKVLQADPVKPSKLKAGLPEGFDTIVARALAKKPDDRFLNAREFQANLLLALHGKPVPTASSPGRRSDPTRTLTPVEAALVDATRAQVPSETAIARAPALAIDPEALLEIERSLSRHMGPLATVLVKRSQRESATLDEFFRALADNIPDDDEQAEFLKKMAALKRSEKSGMSSTKIKAPPPAGNTLSAFNPEVLAKAERLLASYVGPLARVLIKEAAGKSGNLKELYTQLAAHIDSEDERRAFLASLPR
jgi:eukaryotic-like serine/threonine-protein kinase